MNRQAELYSKSSRPIHVKRSLRYARKTSIRKGGTARHSPFAHKLCAEGFSFCALGMSNAESHASVQKLLADFCTFEWLLIGRRPRLRFCKAKPKCTACRRFSRHISSQPTKTKGKNPMNKELAKTYENGDFLLRKSTELLPDCLKERL